jgi:hypothetical protein
LSHRDGPLSCELGGLFNGHQAPRQQFVDSVDGMIGDPFEDSTQIRKWLYIV